MEASSGVNNTQNKHFTLYKILKSLANVRQKQNILYTTYFGEFNAMAEQLKNVRDKSMLWNKQLVEIANGGFLISSDEEREDEEQFLAVIFIIRSDYNRFGDLIKDLLRDDIQGIDNQPTTVTKGFELLQGYETNRLTSYKKWSRTRRWKRRKL